MLEQKTSQEVPNCSGMEHVTLSDSALSGPRHCTPCKCPAGSLQNELSTQSFKSACLKSSFQFH